MFKRLIGKKTVEEKERERINYIKELLSSYLALRPNSSDPVANVAYKHMLDSVIVSRKDGSVLATNTDRAFEKAVRHSSLFEYTRAEFPKMQMLTIKDGDDYHLVYPNGDTIYLLKSSAALSQAEADRIVDQLNSGIQPSGVTVNEITQKALA